MKNLFKSASSFARFVFQNEPAEYSSRVEKVEAYNGERDKLKAHIGNDLWILKDLYSLKEEIGTLKMSKAEAISGLQTLSNKLGDSWKFSSLNHPDALKLTYFVQTIMKESGYDPGTIDGIYGRNKTNGTRGAVIAFQKANGFTGKAVDGWAGPKTIAKILEANGKSTPNLPVNPKPISPKPNPKKDTVAPKIITVDTISIPKDGDLDLGDEELEINIEDENPSKIAEKDNLNLTPEEPLPSKIPLKEKSKEEKIILLEDLYDVKEKAEERLSDLKKHPNTPKYESYKRVLTKAIDGYKQQIKELEKGLSLKPKKLVIEHSGNSNESKNTIPKDEDLDLGDEELEINIENENPAKKEKISENPVKLDVDFKRNEEFIQNNNINIRGSMKVERQ